MANDIVKNAAKLAGEVGLNAGKVAGGVVGMMSGGVFVEVVKPLMNDVVVPTVITKLEPKDLVEVPTICSKEIRQSLADVTKTLEERGLKITPIAVVKDPKYKDCFDGEVVGSNQKSNQKIPRGSYVEVYYVTSDIIEASKLLFEFMKNVTERPKIESKVQKLLTKIREEHNRHNKIMERLNVEYEQAKKELDGLNGDL